MKFISNILVAYHRDPLSLRFAAHSFRLLVLVALVIGSIGCSQYPDEERDFLQAQLEAKAKVLEAHKQEIKNLPLLVQECEKLENEIAKLKKAKAGKKAQ